MLTLSLVNLHKMNTAPSPSTRSGRRTLSSTHGTPHVLPTRAIFPEVITLMASLLMAQFGQCFKVVETELYSVSSFVSGFFLF